VGHTLNFSLVFKVFLDSSPTERSESQWRTDLESGFAVEFPNHRYMFFTAALLDPRTPSYLENVLLRTISDCNRHNCWSLPL